MLQQILKDMYIDPVLLSELSDEQKQILFLKMREEQVKRWKERDDKLEMEEKKRTRRPAPKPGRKRVQFMKGLDGNDWVWVMGDHPNDRTIEEIVEEEAQERALKLAEKEAEELRKREEQEQQRKIEEEKKRQQEELEKEKRRQEEEALYQSIKEARLAAEKLEKERKRKEEEQKKKLEEMQASMVVERRKSLQKMDNMKKRRSDELYIRWKEMRRELERVAEESSKEVEKNWLEQEKKSKEAEEQMKLIAQRAREENRESLKRTSQVIMAANAFRGSGKDHRPPLPPKSNQVISRSKQLSAKRKSRPPRPTNRESVIEWFQEEERLKRPVVDPATQKIATWFHGVISRMDAEKVLIDETVGSFLVRVSEKVWGYTISYRASDRCKHFLIDASDGESYQFFGTSQIPHDSIADLVSYHKENPITMAGKEKLLYPVGQKGAQPDYAELYVNRRSESTSL